MRAVRRVYRDLLKPLFAEIGALEVVVISLAAGIGEELFFRGALQPEVGLIPASLVFGVLHMGTRGTIAFGGWAAVMGAALGWLAVATEGLLAPIVGPPAGREARRLRRRTQLSDVLRRSFTERGDGPERLVREASRGARIRECGCDWLSSH